MRRRIASSLLVLTLAAPAGAQPREVEVDEPAEVKSTLGQRTLWVGIGGGAVTLLGTGLWLGAVHWSGVARDAGDVSAARGAQHLGVIGGGLTLAGLCALGAAAVMSSWRASPVTVSFSLNPGGGFTLLLGSRAF